MEPWKRPGFHFRQATIGTCTASGHCIGRVAIEEFEHIGSNLMTQFKVPTREEVSEANQAIFDKLQGMVGFVPNLYAYYANNETALGDYLTPQNRKSTLRAKEREVVNLVVSQVNECDYCLAAHTAIGKMNGFSEKETVDIRKGDVSFDEKLGALARLFAKPRISEASHRPRRSRHSLRPDTPEALLDVLIVIGDKTISNFSTA